MNHAVVAEEAAAEIEAQEEIPEKDLKKNQRGVAAFQEGNLEGALKYVDQFLGEHEKFSDAHVLKARIQIRNREYDLAIASIQRAVQLNPNSSEAYYYLGQAYEKHGKLQESRACYQRTLELEPEGPRAEHLREWLDRAQQATIVPQAEVVCDRCLRKFEQRYVVEYDDKKTCRWCLDLIEAQTGGGLVAQYFPDLIREEQERDQLDPNAAVLAPAAVEMAGGRNKLMFVAAGGGVLVLALLGAIWFKMHRKAEEIKPVNPGQSVVVVKPKKFDPKLLKLVLKPAQSELQPDQPFEASVDLEGTQPGLADVSLELKDCPDGAHLDPGHTQLLWQTPPSFDPSLKETSTPFTLTVVAVARAKDGTTVLANVPATITVKVLKMSPELAAAKNYSWVHDPPKQLFPMERMRWMVQGQGLGSLQMKVKILQAPPDAKIVVVNGISELRWQAPFEATVGGVMQRKSYDFELEMSIFDKQHPDETYYPRKYSFSVQTGFEVTAPRMLDLKLDASERVMLDAGRLLQAPSEYPDSIVIAHGRPLNQGTLTYLSFADAGDTLSMTDACDVPLQGMPLFVRAGNWFQGRVNRDDVAAVELFSRRLDFVPQSTGGLPAATPTSYSLATVPGALIPFDVDRDGRNDLVYADQRGSALHVALQGADGKFRTNADGRLQTLDCPVDPYDAPVRLVDLRSSNRLVLVSGWEQGKVKIQLLGVKWPPAAGAAPIVPLAEPLYDSGPDARWFVDAVRIKTADRDWLGVVTGGPSRSHVDLYRPVGDRLEHLPPDPKLLGSFDLPADIPAPPTRCVVQDLNRDGLDDLVVGYPHRIDIYWQISGETSSLLLIKSVTDPNLTGDFVLADVNHDGSLDIVAYDARQKLQVYLMH